MIKPREILQLVFVLSVIFIIVFLIAQKLENEDKEYIKPEEALCGKFGGIFLTVSKEKLYKFKNRHIKIEIDNFKIVLTCRGE